MLYNLHIKKSSNKNKKRTKNKHTRKYVQKREDDKQNKETDKLRSIIWEVHHPQYAISSY